MGQDHVLIDNMNSIGDVGLSKSETRKTVD